MDTKPASAVVSSVAINVIGGESFDALVSGPGDAQIGILLIHDWFGVTDFTREAVAKLGSSGHRTIAVDLYGGSSAKTHKEAFALMKGVDKAAAYAVIRAGLEYLKSPDRKLAIIGFSMGGAYAIGSALDYPNEVSTAIVWYGAPESDSARLSTLQAPVLIIGGGKDEPDASYKFAQLMVSIDKSVEVHIFSGLGHAFAQPLFNGGKNYNKVATNTSWLLTEDFLQRHLGEY